MRRPTCAALAALMVPVCAAAQESVAFSAAVDLSYKQLRLEEVAGPDIVNVFNPGLWMVSISPSVAYRGFFASAGFERSLGEASTAGHYAAGFETRTWRREENNLSVGYNVWRGLSVFAGKLRNHTVAVIHPFREYTYTEDGPYYGIGYSHRFPGGGALSASVASTRADGSLRETRFVTERLGDVTGESYSLSWSAPLTGSMFYRIGYKANRYEFEFTDPFFGQRTTKQAFDAFVLGVANYF